MNTPHDDPALRRRNIRLAVVLGLEAAAFAGPWIAGLFVVIGLTGLAVLLATLFNLITDLVGGMRFTVLEEEVVEARPSPMRRFVVRRAEPEVPHVSYDQSGPIVREAFIDDSGGVPR